MCVCDCMFSLKPAMMIVTADLHILLLALSLISTLIRVAWAETGEKF